MEGSGRGMKVFTAVVLGAAWGWCTPSINPNPWFWVPAALFGGFAIGAAVPYIMEKFSL